MATSRDREQLGQRLLRMKEELEQKKSQRSELQGELNSVMKQLQEEFGVGTLEQAEERLEKEKQELQEMETAVQEQVEEIEEMMESSHA